MISEKNTAF